MNSVNGAKSIFAFTPLMLVTLSSLTIVISACAASRSTTQPGPDPLERIPDTWIDLPEAPFVARIEKNEAVLVNRSKTTFNNIQTGCVLNEAGIVKVIGELVTTNICDSEWAPGARITGVLRMLNNIDWYVSKNLVKPCPSGSRMALVRATRDQAQEWSAGGTRWTR